MIPAISATHANGRNDPNPNPPPADDALSAAAPLLLFSAAVCLVALAMGAIALGGLP